MATPPSGARFAPSSVVTVVVFFVVVLVLEGPAGGVVSILIPRHVMTPVTVPHKINLTNFLIVPMACGPSNLNPKP